MVASEYKMIIKSSDEFKDFIKKGSYEPYLLDLINRSKLFKYNIELIDCQSNGEDDYIEDITGKTYEATLLNNKDVIRRIINHSELFWNGEFESWINNEIQNEFVIRLERKVKKNRIIVFNIYPFIGTKFGSVIDYIGQDVWDLAIASISINKPELIEDKEIIVVSFNYNNMFYVKRVVPNNNRPQNLAFVTDYDEDDYIFKMIDIKICE